MAEIYDLFIEEDKELLRNVMAETGRLDLCWYPSAGADFDSIRQVESRYQHRRPGVRVTSERVTARPFYVFTDVSIGMLKREFLSEDYQYRRDAVGFRGITELRLKKPRIASECSTEIYSFSPDENIGRVFLLTFGPDDWKQRARDGVSDALTIPVLYFVDENLTFMVRSLIANRIKVHTLFHKNDGGGSFGGSRTPMYFIYQACDYLGMQLIFSTYSERGLPPLYEEAFDSFMVEFNLAGLGEKIDSAELPAPGFISPLEFDRRGWRLRKGERDCVVWERLGIPEELGIFSRY